MAHGLIYLHNQRILTDENHDEIQKTPFPDAMATRIGTALCKKNKDDGLFSNSSIPVVGVDANQNFTPIDPLLPEMRR